jgi:protoporphyrinogen oxidase
VAIGILRGGLAGLIIATHLDHDCEVLEKESSGGGHCQTVNAVRGNSLVTISMGLDVARIPDYARIYVPDPKIRSHRLSFPAAFSPHNAPPGESIMQAEVTTNPGDGMHEMSDDALLSDVISDMENIDLVRRLEVCARTQSPIRLRRSERRLPPLLEESRSLFRADRHPAVRTRRRI